MVLNAISPMKNLTSPALPGAPALELEEQAAPVDQNSFAEILSEFEQQHHGHPSGQALEGTVVSITPESVFVDVGRKMDGVLPIESLPRSIRRVLDQNRGPAGGQHHGHGRRILHAFDREGGATPRLECAGTRVCRETFDRRRRYRTGEGRPASGRRRAGFHAGIAQRSAKIRRRWRNW